MSAILRLSFLLSPPFLLSLVIASFNSLGHIFICCANIFGRQHNLSFIWRLPGCFHMISCFLFYRLGLLLTQTIFLTDRRLLSVILGKNYHLIKWVFFLKLTCEKIITGALGKAVGKRETINNYECK